MYKTSSALLQVQLMLHQKQGTGKASGCHKGAEQDRGDAGHAEIENRSLHTVQKPHEDFTSQSSDNTERHVDSKVNADSPQDSVLTGKLPDADRYVKHCYNLHCCHKAFHKI